MAPSTEERMRSAADNAIVLLLSRYSMVAAAPILGLLLFLAKGYVNDFDHRIVTAQSDADRANAAIVELRSQQALLTQSLSTTTAAWALWQSSVNTRLDKVTDALNGLSVSVAGLNATVQQINR